MTEQVQGQAAPEQPVGGVVTTTEKPAIRTDIEPAKALVSRLTVASAEQAASYDATELMYSSVTNIAEATSVDDILDANETAGLPSLKESDYLWNTPLSVFDVTFQKSDAKYADGGLGSFAIIWAASDRGEELNFSTGAPNVVASLFKARELGYCTAEKPWRIVFVAKDTANGVLLKIGRPKI